MNAHAGAHLPSHVRMERQLHLWQMEPQAFAYDVCGMRCEPWLEAVYADMAIGLDVSVRSCHGPGKTAGAAVAILWFMGTRFPVRIPCTAPTAHQLRYVLWAEIAKWHAEMTPEWHQRYIWKSLLLEWASAPHRSFAVGRTARPGNDEALAGHHGKHVLYVAEEATGVSEGTFEVAEGAMTERGAQQLLISNPTRLSGYFYDSHHSMRAHFACHHVSYRDSQRVTDGYVERMARKWGRQSNIFRVRVGGEFPLRESDAVVPFDLAHAAVGRDIELNPRIAPIWGVDVARFGDDDSALSKRQGAVLLEPPIAKHGYSTMQWAGFIYREYMDTPEPQRPSHICIDTIGLGSGVFDRLEETLADEPVEVVSVNVSERPADREHYLKLRDELWFDARAWFETQTCRLPPEGCDDLLGELTAVKYHPPNSEGKIKVYSKEEMQKPQPGGRPALLRHSPNEADSFINTFAVPHSAPRPQQYDTGGGRRYRRQPRRRRTFPNVA